MNSIEQAGMLAIASRMQRLSEQLRKDGAEIYRSFDIQFEPKWFPVIYALHQKTQLSVVEVASEIGYTHPSTISLLKELEKQKLVRSVKDKTDERKRLIRLTEKGIALVAQMQPVWELIEKTITRITDTRNNLLKAITEVEEELKKKSFLQRALESKSAKKK